MNRVLFPSSNFVQGKLRIDASSLGAQDPPTQLQVLIVIGQSLAISYGSPTLYTMTQGNWNGLPYTTHILNL